MFFRDRTTRNLRSTPISSRVSLITLSCLLSLNVWGETTRLDVFVIGTDHGLYHKAWDSNWSTWTEWNALGAKYTSDPAAVSWGSNRIDVFARGSDNACWHSYWDGNWHMNWESLGGALAGAPDVSSWGPGRLDVFARTTNNTIIHRAFNGASWADWEDLGGNVASDPSAVSSGPNRIDVFARGADGTLQRKYWEGAAWSAWESLGGNLQGAPDAASWGTNRLDVFARDNNNTLNHLAWTGSQWSPWENLGGHCTSDPGTVSREPNRIDVFIRDAATTCAHKWWDGTNWSTWENIDGYLIGGPDAASWTRAPEPPSIAKTSPAFLLRNQSPLMIPYRTRLWQVDDGLPHNTVQAITQSRDGYLWVGTAKGLARFNGIEFKTVDRETLSAPLESDINALLEDQNGILWLGLNDGRVLQRRGETFHICQFPGALPHNPILNLYEAKDGAVWVGMLKGVARCTNGTSIEWVDSQFFTNTVKAFCEEPDRGMWIGTASGLILWNQGVLAKYSETNGLGYPQVRALQRDARGHLWIGTSSALFRFSAGQLVAYGQKEGLADINISAIHQDRLGSLWVGASGGLYRLHQGKFIMEVDQDKNPYERVSSFFEDRENNLWVGSKDGLHRLNPARFHSYTTQNGLAHNNVMSVCEDGAGIIWFGTWGGGLHQMQDGRISFIPPPSISADNSGMVLSLCAARDSLWFGMDYDGGAWQLKESRFIHYDKSQRGLNDPVVRVIYQDKSGGMWIGTERALHHLNNKQTARYTVENGLAANKIRSLLEDQQRRLWIGTESGLTCFREGTFHSFTATNGFASHPVTALHEDNRGTLWIGTTGAGLWKMTPDEVLHAKFSHYSTKDGLFSDDIFEILEDDFGYFWMTSLKGIFRVSRKALDDFQPGQIGTLACVNYGKSDGMSTVQCNGVSKPAAWKSRDGRLWFATAKGLIVTDPGVDLERNGTPPSVVIEEVVFDKEVQSQRKGANDSTSSLEVEPLNLRPGRGELEFHYTALSFTAPEKNRYRYKLEGFDQDWMEAGTRRSAHYSNIRPGDYRFTVIACNNDGTWNSVGASMKLTLQPQFWETTWFTMLMALTGVALVASSARYVVWRKVRRRFELLEQQHAVEKERARIAQDMHDDLGLRLTEILFASDLAARDKSAGDTIKTHIAKVSSTAREVIDNLDGIVWAVNPKNDSFDILIGYISEYTEAVLKNVSIRCRLDIPNDPPRHPVSSETRHHVFMVIKEALHNIVKHTSASEVSLRVTCDDTALCFVIEDNGRGFSGSSKAPSFGNGLQNMEKRMKSIGGIFHCESEPGKGTRVQLKVPLHR